MSPAPYVCIIYFLAIGMAYSTSDTNPVKSSSWSQQASYFEDLKTYC